jgi:hypothetical protein
MYLYDDAEQIVTTHKPYEKPAYSFFTAWFML